MSEFELPVEPVQHLQPVQPNNPNWQDLPLTFCVKTFQGTRQGYYLLRWSNGGLDPNGKIIHVIKSMNHMNRYYNIGTTQRPVTPYNVISRKNNGNITRPMSWRYTGEKLVHGENNIPVLRITPMNTLPSMPNGSFIPIIPPVQAQPQQPVQQPVQPQPVQPVHQVINYPIKTIPTHIILALLRDAAMQEELCPITSEEIDVSNGAVTSCFHLFEKNAIMQWLLLPNSRDKCPVCNCPCNSYSLDDVPPLG
jgi:hypothetical protein